MNDYLPQYRLHTPAEVLKRNHVSRLDVVRDVVLQQVIQTVFGLAISYLEPAECIGREEYDTAVWARRIRIAQMAIPHVLSLAGVDATGLAENLSPSYPMLAGALKGGQYPFLTQTIVSEAGDSVDAPAFAGWELAVAGFIYWFFIPALQFIWGVLFVDTWQYFLHRAMHMNKWLYSKCNFPSQLRPCRMKAKLILTLQPNSTLVTTAFMSPTPSVPYIIIPSRAFFWTPQAQVLLSSPLA